MFSLSASTYQIQLICHNLAALFVWVNTTMSLYPLTFLQLKSKMNMFLVIKIIFYGSTFYQKDSPQQ